jgi:hypothetical protein
MKYLPSTLGVGHPQTLVKIPMVTMCHTNVRLLLVKHITVTDLHFLVNIEQ